MHIAVLSAIVESFGVALVQDPDAMPSIMRERREIGAFYYRFPDGESGADVYDRVDNFVEHLHRLFRKSSATRGSNRRAHVVSRSDRHGRTRHDFDCHMTQPSSPPTEPAQPTTLRVAAARGFTSFDA